MYPHVLEVGHQVVYVVVYDVGGHVAGPFAGVGDERFEMDLEVQQAGFWVDGVAVVDKLVAADCQANAMCFGLGQLNVTDEVGARGFFTLGDSLFGDKKYCVGAFNSFGWETGFASALCQAEKFVGGGNFPIRFFGDRTESLQRGLGTGIGVDH